MHWELPQLVALQESQAHAQAQGVQEAAGNADRPCLSSAQWSVILRDSGQQTFLIPHSALTVSEATDCFSAPALPACLF